MVLKLTGSKAVNVFLWKAFICYGSTEIGFNTFEQLQL